MFIVKILNSPLIDLEKLLNTKVEVVTERGLKDRIRLRVINEAVPLCETLMSV